MPATSIRDLVVHRDDIVAGTHGRSFWILDDITPLRQINANTSSGNSLFAPQLATRVRRSVHTDTPFPPEEPAGQNPPDGAIINYYLKARQAAPVVLEIFDSAGKLVRKLSSDDKPLSYDESKLRFPTYWIRPNQSLVNELGMQRFVWDLRYPRPAVAEFDLPISAVFNDTPFEPLGPFVLPGNYTIKLTVDGKTFAQPLKIRMDPRVTANAAELQLQFSLSMRAYEGIRVTRELIDEISSMKAKIREKGLEKRVDALLNGTGRSGPTALNEFPLNRLHGAFASLLDLLQDVDAAPTTQSMNAARDLDAALVRIGREWAEIKALLQ
ncbi:MAG: hypothetical protein IPJ30_23305 [Acidobacteria bacterium]|nr:hypothetical protein [Acidobacteriota bacterium]